MTKELNLQLFAEGGATAGATSATTATGTTGTVGETSTSVPTGNENTTVLYGKQEKNIGKSDSTKKEKSSRKTFEELVNSEEYSEEAKEYMNKHFSKRLSKFKGYEAENAKMKEILEMQNLRYGLDSSSATYLDDYAKKVQNDTKLFEDEALEMGVPVEEYLKIKNAELIISQNKRNEENRQRNSVIQNHLQNMIGQAEQLKTEFPNFDIEKELNDNRFKRLVDPPELGGAGISVKDAYFAVHNKEIMKATVSNAVNQAQIRTANAVTSNKERPVENGLSNNASVIIKDDPSQFKLDDFKKIKETYRRTGYRPKF